MTALDDLLMKKYRESIAELTSRMDTAQAAVDRESEVSSMETLVAAVGGPVLGEPEPNGPPTNPPTDESSSAATDETQTEVAQTEVAHTEAAKLEVKSDVHENLVDVIQLPVAADSENVAPAETEMNQTDMAASDDSNESQTREPEPGEFKAEWEIDRFPWPEICGDVEERVENQLTEALERIKLACLARDCRSIVLTSANEGAGRTTMTLCLAREAARQGMTVAVVELDHAAPDMLSVMGIDFEKGIESIPQDDVALRDISLIAIEDGVTLIPAVRPFDASMCTSAEMKQLLVTVTANHDLVLIDASREVADALSASPAQGIVMVRGPESRDATDAFLDWIKEKNAWTVGIIENFAA